MKDIKDYLHLYLGCEIIWISMPDVREHLTYEVACTIEYDNLYEDFKPILRPLSDMTEEENMQAGKIHLSAHYSDTPNITVVAEYTRYLLSKHFDLFGLIEEGFAIDKAKIF